MTTIPTSPKSPCSISDRFWSKVSIETDEDSCWPWLAARQRHPRSKAPTYGFFWVGSKRDGSGRMAAAHVVSWQLKHGPIPDGMRVLHRCDNPACVRPEHLFLGSQGDNVRDMIEKGRKNAAQGVQHGCAKLSEQQVLEIRARYNKGKWGSARRLAVEFGVKPGTIVDVCSRSWRHV